MSLQLKDFEIVLNRNSPHIKIEYRYDDPITRVRYCIYLFDEGLVGLHHFILYEENYEESYSQIVESLNGALLAINYAKVA